MPFVRWDWWWSEDESAACHSVWWGSNHGDDEQAEWAERRASAAKELGEPGCLCLRRKLGTLVRRDTHGEGTFGRPVPEW